MPLYIITSLRKDTTPVNTAVARHIPEPDRFHLQDDRGWLVKFAGTTVELSNHLEITGQEKNVPSPVGPALIVPMGGYYGRGPTDMWEWVKTRWEA